MWGSLWQLCLPKGSPGPSGSISVFLQGFVKPLKSGPEGRLELAVTGASALVVAACGWWIRDDEASCGRLPRPPIYEAKIFGAAANSQQSDFRGRTK